MSTHRTCRRGISVMVSVTVSLRVLQHYDWLAVGAILGCVVATVAVDLVVVVATLAGSGTGRHSSGAFELTGWGYGGSLL